MASRQRIVVGLSGGVDSSVAAWLLKQQGHEVIGVFMKNWEDDDTDTYCTSRQDLIDAASVADVIGIEFDAVNFAAEYRERVFAGFLREYEAGRTPNPDVLCNNDVEFRAFPDPAMTLGADALATGHYARVMRNEDGRAMLLKARDTSKDQSYFLHQLRQAQLQPACFPLGDLLKSEVRDIAKCEGLSTWQKKDSTGICFIGERPFREFLERYLPRAPGRMVTPEGTVVGEHQGLAYYTLGQRQGLGIGGTHDGDGAPWFVAEKRLQENELVVVQGHDHPLLYNDTVTVQQLHWIASEPPDLSHHNDIKTYGAKLRYRMPDAPCRIEWRDDDTLTAHFDAPQWTPTPGQYGVFYDGEVCLGGGVIVGGALASRSVSTA
ncbi:MAG: tRNA 2-thiouridine(34) synthase MnmA [Burkholderiales bacterium]|jgi:tRNA-specific 2-thiouridylase|nr:tRNA 2-thiouridine(34) synthase MnmA [Burkholderiales bacterium]